VVCRLCLPLDQYPRSNRLARHARLIKIEQGRTLLQKRKATVHYITLTSRLLVRARRSGLRRLARRIPLLRDLFPAKTRRAGGLRASPLFLQSQEGIRSGLVCHQSGPSARVSRACARRLFCPILQCIIRRSSGACGFNGLIALAFSWNTIDRAC
jgi:hypothetical protein